MEHLGVPPKSPRLTWSDILHQLNSFSTYCEAKAKLVLLYHHTSMDESRTWKKRRALCEKEKGLRRFWQHKKPASPGAITCGLHRDVKRWLPLLGGRRLAFWIPDGQTAEPSERGGKHRGLRKWSSGAVAETEQIGRAARFLRWTVVSQSTCWPTVSLWRGSLPHAGYNSVFFMAVSVTWRQTKRCVPDQLLFMSSTVVPLIPWNTELAEKVRIFVFGSLLLCGKQCKTLNL